MLLQLEFGVYDAVANFNIGLKYSILTYEKMSMVSGRYTLKCCKTVNKKRPLALKYNELATTKNRRKIRRAKSRDKDDVNEVKKGTFYADGAF